MTDVPARLEALSRLEQMARDDQQTWDLSRNDQAAIRRVLDDLAVAQGEAASARREAEELRAELAIEKGEAQKWWGSSTALREALRLLVAALDADVSDPISLSINAEHDALQAARRALAPREGERHG